MKTKPSDLVGRRFGRLVVSHVGGPRNGKTELVCVCDCGESTLATVAHLVQGRRVSCGCAKREGHVKHGMRFSPEYSVWSDMVKRCNNPRHISYRYYGGKGISVCERWRDFSKFYEDMGSRPEGLTIDRIDGSRGYEPGNCRWATYQTQTENRECQKLYEFDGEMVTLPKLGEIVGVNHKTIRSRMVRGGLTMFQAINHKPGTPIPRKSV